MRRNRGANGYFHQQAQRLAQQRRSAASSGPRKLTPAIWSLVRALLLQWSPEQIAGRLDLSGVVSVSFSWIYKQIHQDRARGGKLFIFLRQRGRKRRQPAAAGAAGRGCIPQRTDISERPRIVKARQRVGDWEGDTILGKGHQGAAVTLVDRVSKYLVLHPVARRTAVLVGDAVTSPPDPFQALVLTLTFDNGMEFADHRDMARALAAEVYFARPYRSCERGLNEDTNGLLRQYVGKSESLLEVAPERLRRAAELINHRRRKALQFRTPHEVFSAACRAAGLPADLPRLTGPAAPITRFSGLPLGRPAHRGEPTHWPSLAAPTSPPSLTFWPTVRYPP